MRDRVPAYLRPFIVQQNASLYTPIDHAAWRFIMKISRAYFAQHAHRKFLDGLEETGISSERIPLIEEMDAKLQKFGWGAVAVSGFIPPAAFMDFLASGILPIACDMRRLENLSYTPAPDIVHEAAGHAPIIADPDYAAYLRQYGDISKKAITSAQDLAVYQAIRELSDLKEDPAARADAIAAAQRRLDEAVAANDTVTEATELSRMAWWTIEYGLVGDFKSPRIYGAGLLSSVFESYHCLDAQVKKVPLTLDCVRQAYDITKPQPQLYVAPDFAALGQVLGEFRETMAFRRGGMESLRKAIQARNLTTSQYDSGVQVSGLLAEVLTDSAGIPAYLQLKGPVQLAYEDAQLADQGPEYHREGFGSPVGRLKPWGKSPADVSLSELRGELADRGALEFESGVRVQGKLRGAVTRAGKNLLLIFDQCTVTYREKTLFEPAWGTYDMACGAKITSVFGDAADRRAYLQATGGFRQTPGKPRSNSTPQTVGLEKLYARVRALREKKVTGEKLLAELSDVAAALNREHPEDWLLRYELLELDAAHALHASGAGALRERLAAIATSSPDKRELIARGLELL